MVIARIRVLHIEEYRAPIRATVHKNVRSMRISRLHEQDFHKDMFSPVKNDAFFVGVRCNAGEYRRGPCIKTKHSYGTESISGIRLIYP